MRRWVLTLGALAAGWVLAAPAAAQGLRTVAAPEDAAVTLTTRVRHVTTVALPETAEIVDVVVGDAEHWDVSAAAHLAFVRPLAPGARSNLVLLTASGAIVPLALVESADGAVDSLVRIDLGATETESTGRALAAAGAVEAKAADAAKAWEEVATAEVQGTERVEAARSAAQAELDARREAYPRQASFDYRWAGDASGYPWLVEGMWHDGRRTYLRTRALSPVLYERVGGELEPVAAPRVLDDVLHVVPRVLGSGALEAGGRRLAWSVSPREVGP